MPSLGFYECNKCRLFIKTIKCSEVSKYSDFKTAKDTYLIFGNCQWIWSRYTSTFLRIFWKFSCGCWLACEGMVHFLMKMLKIISLPLNGRIKFMLNLDCLFQPRKVSFFYKIPLLFFRYFPFGLCDTALKLLPPSQIWLAYRKKKKNRQT